MKPQKPNRNTSQKTEKAIIFDSGTLISFSMNGLTGILKELKSVFSGKFLITQEVKREVIDVPVKIKRFELEALKIKRLLDEGTLELPGSLGIGDSEVSDRARKKLDKANSFFRGNGRDIHLLDIGEASCLALSRILTEKGIKNVIAVDERTTRMIVENHENLKEYLEDKLHVKITINHENLKLFNGFKIIRSAELAYVAYKKGLVELKDGTLVLDALLYALKFKGAAISGDEIEQMKKL
ncbi:MAG: hypothetical protein Q8P79_00300 [Nanoarchaeota archaeon]|nr:hypothetical protein [Nanoarchaeota archaeon]